MADIVPDQRLMAILAADVAGYSRLMQDDERATVATLEDYRAVFHEHVRAGGGRIVDTAGDSVLAVFATATGAAGAAAAIQGVLAARNQTLAEARRMRFRIGVNLGEVIERPDGTVYGDGVNIAARLEALAEPGAITISGSIHDQVKNKLDFAFDFTGEQQVKNIANPVRTYRLLWDGTAEAPARRDWTVPITIAVCALIAIAIVVWQAGIFAPSPAGPEVATEELDSVLELPAGPSIAVLPFANLSGDADQDYFADGISEDILTRLTRFPDLAVIARNSTFRYRGQSVDVRTIGTELGADYVLEGSIRRDSDRIRITAQLLGTGDGTHVWAETYDRELNADSIFDLQDDITQRVVGAIADTGGIIRQSDFAKSSTSPPESLSAYECVLRAYEFYRVLDGETHSQARSCLERTVVLEPNYAEALAFLAFIEQESHSLGFNPRPDSLEKASDYAQRAVAADPSNQNAQLTLARTYFFQHDIDSFAARGLDVVALNPNNAQAVASVGMHLALAGQWQEGLPLLERAIQLNPRHPGWYLSPFADYYYSRGEYDKALEYAQRVQSIMPDFYETHATLAAIYGQLGRIPEAEAAVARVLELFPGYPDFATANRQRWNNPPDLIERYREGLAKAGLDLLELSAEAGQ